MVAQHYRWDFYGLSTDSKPDATNPKVANGSTYYEADTSKLYVWYKDQWYEKQSTGGGGGEAGAFKTLTTDDYDYPENNPDGIATWLLPAGIYLTSWGTHFYFNTTKKFNGSSSFVIITGMQNSEDGAEQRVLFFGGIGSNYVQDTVNGITSGRSSFDVTSAN